jgi:drug/metabolite transporter (DMT)-like permease
VSAPAAVTSAERRLAEIGVLVTMVVWSGNFVVVKAAMDTFGPVTFSAIRFTFASLVLLAILRWREGSFRWPGPKAPALFALGAIGFGAYQVLWMVGLTQITAGDSALLIAAAPVFTALLAAAVGMDALTVPKLGGALLAFAGVGLVIAGGHELSLGASLLGDLLTLAAALCWAVYTVGSAKILRGLSALQLTTWTMVAGAVVLIPFGVVESSGRPPMSLDAPAIGALLYSGVLAAAMANVFVMRAIGIIGPTKVVASQFLVPAGAVVLGALFLAEPVGPGQVIGGAVIVLGVWITRQSRLVPARIRSRLSSGA